MTYYSLWFAFGRVRAVNLCKICQTAKDTRELDHRMKICRCRRRQSQRWSVVCLKNMWFISELFNCYLFPIVWFSELLPPEVTCAKETRDLVIECCVGEHRQWSSCASLGLTHLIEFIHLISSEANEICEQESKKTIAPEHIIAALKVCLWLTSILRWLCCSG